MCRGSRTRIAILTTVLLSPPALAGDFTFDLPDLAGTYADWVPNTVEVDLGMQFAQIDAVSLRLAGVHSPGTLLPLGPGGAHPYPAELMGEVFETAPDRAAAFDELLPVAIGPFDLTFDFRNLRFRLQEPNFDSLIDGRAQLELKAGGGPFIAIYSVGSFPEIRVDSATLVISGQQELDTFMLPGDFDRSGAVDSADYAVWQATIGSDSDLRADANGNGVVDAADYAVWRNAAGANGGAAAQLAGVPEPGAFWLCLFAAALCGTKSQRRVPVNR